MKMIKMGMRPNFLYIGPPKAASTWVYEMLKNHPQVFMSPAKELHYFDIYYHLGERWYLKHFKNAGARYTVVGEVSHDYLYSVDACRRIQRDLGNIKLMVCLREPVERAFSEYLYMVRQGYLRCSFEKAIEERPEIIEHGKYAKYLRPYLDLFGKDNLIIMLFDDLKFSADGYWRQLCDALSIDPTVSPPSKGQQVLHAASPRNWIVARGAKEAAMLMRKAGLSTAVTRVKSSQVVQWLLYRSFERGQEPSIASETREHLKSYFREDVALLDLNYVPGVEALWGYGLERG